MLLSFVSQAFRNLYAAYIHVNAVVEALVPGGLIANRCSGGVSPPTIILWLTRPGEIRTSRRDC